MPNNISEQVTTIVLNLVCLYLTRSAQAMRCRILKQCHESIRGWVQWSERKKWISDFIFITSCLFSTLNHLSRTHAHTHTHLHVHVHTHSHSHSHQRTHIYSLTCCSTKGRCVDRTEGHLSVKGAVGVGWGGFGGREGGNGGGGAQVERF